MIWSLVIAFALVAMAMGDGEDQLANDPARKYGFGMRRFPGAVVAPYRNDLRQHGVTSVAKHLGTGIGTAFKDGVSGTPSGVHDHHFYGHYRGFHGYNPWYNYGYPARYPYYYNHDHIHNHNGYYPYAY